MLMFSGQPQVRISFDFPPKERLEPILSRIGTSNCHDGSSDLEGDPATVGEYVSKRRQEMPTHPYHPGFPVPKLELLVFEGAKPRC